MPMKKKIFVRAIAFAMTAIMAIGDGTVCSYAMSDGSGQAVDETILSSSSAEEDAVYYDLATAMGCANEISMNQDSLTVDKYDKFLLDGNTEIEYAQSAKLFKLPKGYYIMEMSFDITDDMANNGNFPTVCYFNDQNYMWSSSNWASSRDEGGKRIYTFLVEEYYANGSTPTETINYIWVSNMPEGTKCSLSWSMPTEFVGMKDKAVELTINGDEKSPESVEYIKIPNWDYRYEYDEDENMTAVPYLSHYSIVKGAAYKLTLPAGEAVSMVTNNTSYSIGETYYTDLSESSNTITHVSGGELENDSDNSQTYYILATSSDLQSQFEGYALRAAQFPVVSEDMELKDTISDSKTIEGVSTSSEIYKAVSNMKDYDIHYYKGYGNLYKLTVPANKAVTISCDNDLWSGFAYTEGNMDQYIEGLTLSQPTETQQGGNSFVNISDTDMEYYLWIAYDSETTYDIEFKYFDTMKSKYDKAHDFAEEEELNISDAATQDNFIENYYCVRTGKYGLLYHFPEGPAVITVNLSGNAQIDALDAYGNTNYINDSFHKGEGTHTIYTANYNCRGKEGWVLISSDSKEGLNGCSIKYEKQKTFTELNQTNVLKLKEEYVCNSKTDKTLVVNGREYYGYSFDIADYETAIFNVTSSTEQSDYPNMSFANDFGGSLMAGVYSSNAEINIYKNDLKGLGTNVILLVPKTYEQYGSLPDGSWGVIQCETKVDDIKIKVTLPPSLDDYKDQAIELTDGNVYIQEKTTDYEYIMDRTALFKTVVPKGYSATLRVRNQAFYKNAAVYEDLKAEPIAMDEHEGYTTILLDIPANDEEDKLYYIDLYYRLFQYSETQVEIILKDEWRRNNKFDKYPVGVSGTDMTIDLSKLEEQGLIVDNIKNVTNGTFDKDNKTIVVQDISKVVGYDYLIDNHYVDMKLVPYEKADKAVLVSEGQDTDKDGNIVENLIEVSTEGELSGIVTETTMNAMVSEDATLKLIESKDISGESTNDAEVSLEQSAVSSEDIQKAIELAEEKNQSYVQNSQSASIETITTSFTEETNTQIVSDVFGMIQADTDNSKKGYDIAIAKKDAEGNDEYIWNFKGSEISDSSKSLNPDMEVQDEYDEKIQELVKNDKKVSVLNFKNSGILPGVATVKIYVGDKYKDGQELTCSYFDETNNILTEEQNLTVEDGFITIKITHCSDYVLKLIKHTDSEHTVVVDEAVAATCTKTGLTEGSHCSVCEEVIKPQEIVEKLAHTYDQKVMSDDTLMSEATYDSPAVYFYTCSCGAIGKDTFTFGEPVEKPTTEEPDDEEPVTPPTTEKPAPEEPINPPAEIQTPDVNVTYHTHIQTYGDTQGTKKNGEMAGTSGESKRLENIWIKVNGNENLGIQYSTHCQTYGWMAWSCDGETNGTSGEAKRLEAIKIQLTGADKDKYDIYYRVHAQSYGWLGWAKNGEPSGTAGHAKRLEGIQVVVVKKGEAAPGLKYAGVDGSSSKYSNQAYVDKNNAAIVIPGDVNAPIVSYKTHVQSFGWQKWVYNGAMSGTEGKAKRLEGINIKVTNCPYEGDIVYTTHVQKYGWKDGKPQDASRASWKKNGEMSGTSGEAKRLEAICIDLTGEMGEKYDVYYRVHAQSYGWLGWAKNGECSGTAGYAKRLEGIQVVLVEKGGAAPAKSYGGITSVQDKAYIEK